jgi:membrane protein DedA with SNARE-associated domain
MPVTTTFLGELQQLVSLHGYWVIGLIVGLESLGLPLPGETILVLAAIYAATEPSLNIWVVIAVAAFGAIIGDNIGYWFGSRYGYALLLRYGERIGMFEPRIKLGQEISRPHIRFDSGRRVLHLCRMLWRLRSFPDFVEPCLPTLTPTVNFSGRRSWATKSRRLWRYHGQSSPCEREDAGGNAAERL